MSFNITIQGQVIEFPSSGESPNWAPAVIAFAQAVENALQSVISDYDVAPQIQSINAAGPETNQDIDSLLFPVSEVRAANIFYTVYRKTDLEEISETGILQTNYNAANGVGSKWEFSREGIGDAQITFNITDAGQIQYSTVAITGSSDTGIISFRALSVLNT